MKPPQKGTLQYRYDYDWCVCFRPRKDCENWLGKIFGHVLLYRNISAINCVRIEPTLYGTLIVPYTCNVNSIAKSLNEDYSTFIWHTKQEDMSRINFICGIGTCVSIVKNLLGIRAWCVITPRQLEKYILNRT